MAKSVATVTGASSGIGRMTAIRVAHDFSGVVLAARGTTALSEVADAVRMQGAEPLALEIDLMEPAAAESVVGRALAETLLTKSGIGRYGEPQDIAELMTFLVSPAARWMTGTQLRIDGGEVKSI